MDAAPWVSHGSHVAGRLDALSHEELAEIKPASVETESSCFPPLSITPWLSALRNFPPYPDLFFHSSPFSHIQLPLGGCQTFPLAPPPSCKLSPTAPNAAEVAPSPGSPASSESRGPGCCCSLPL